MESPNSMLTDLEPELHIPVKNRAKIDSEILE